MSFKVKLICILMSLFSVSAFAFFKSAPNMSQVALAISAETGAEIANVESEMIYFKDGHVCRYEYNDANDYHGAAECYLGSEYMQTYCISSERFKRGYSAWVCN